MASFKISRIKVGINRITACNSEITIWIPLTNTLNKVWFILVLFRKLSGRALHHFEVFSGLWSIMIRSTERAVLSPQYFPMLWYWKIRPVGSWSVLSLKSVFQVLLHTLCHNTVSVTRSSLSVQWWTPVLWTPVLYHTSFSDRKHTHSQYLKPILC